MSDVCANCPRVTEAHALFPEQAQVRYCFECPHGYVGSRFTALVQKLEGRTAIHSCRRQPLER
jgi:hypothetical protein